ncbi:MAG: hypothetical protein AMXMBFR25_03670 [Lysobacterales bacterium]|nr:hypothetical protein [Xanthomonadales bacterium]
MRVFHAWTSALALLALAGCERGGVSLVGGEVAIDPAACGTPAVLISSIQGAALKSSLQGQLTTTEAVVIADAIDGLGGVFLQEEQADRDGDPMTSEGLFVQIDGARPKVERGDVVRVQGRVAEIGEGEATLTTLVELSSFQFCGKVDELPQPALVEEAPLVAEDWEALESMGVRIEPIATLLANHALLSRGELLVGLDGRQWSPTERHPPGAEARALAADNARRRLLLDDGSIAPELPERQSWLPAPPSIDAPYRIGSSLRGITGVLDQRAGSYRLHVQERVEVVQASRPESAPEVAGGLRVASMNVLNYFNGDGKSGGFPTERGASDAEELARQRAKILSALKAMDADLYVLMEVENDGYERGSAIAELTQRLNQARGRPREYDYVRAPGERLGGDLISVGMLYRPRQLKLVGTAATLQEPPFDHGSRAPLAQTFEQAKTQARFTVVANHWKSKGGCETADAANQDRGDGQGCWNAARVEAARLLKDWLASDPTGSGDPDVLIVGDLNSHSQEDPLRLLYDAGYVQLGHRDGGHYSFNYDGSSGSLDHALASTGLAPQARGASVWHINADEMPDFDYNREGRARAVDARMFRADPFRSSDHDPLLVGFDLDPPAAEPEPPTNAAPADPAAR